MPGGAGTAEQQQRYKWGETVDHTILNIENVSKTYPGVKALNNVSFSIQKGEVRALIGENGAGKSTLIKCIMGVETPDSGKVELQYKGDWVTAKNAIEAKELGMHANYQHVNIAKELSVAENYFLGKMPITKAGFINWKKVNEDSLAILKKFDLDVDPRMMIRELPVAMQEMISISKISVNDEINLVIFDEPTALLENDKVEILYKYIRELKENGVSVIYISHRLEEIIEICDTVTVLKDGTYVDTKAVGELDKDSMVSMMVGRSVEDIYGIRHAQAGEELLRVENMTHETYFKNISFDVHRGEIVGFFGLVGAGRSEVMKCIFGADKLASGSIYIKGKKVSIKNPLDAMKNSIGFIPEDRREEGLALELSIKTNINMSSYDMISTAGFINLGKEDQRAKEYEKKIAIKTPDVLQAVKNLSGGNQQKVVVSKLLCRDPEVLIFDEPTVGVDVGAKEEIYKLMEQLLAEGKGIILISSYLPEVMGLSDRMLIMSDGEIVGEISKEEIVRTEEREVLKIASKLH